MHTIHHTRAVILKSQPIRETDKMYWLFTEDFGLVVAVATGIRKPGAKLAGQLVDCSFIEADLVKGRDIWRLVSATLESTPLLGNTKHPLARAYVRMLATLDRFLVDEGVHGELFADVYAAGQLMGTTYIDSKKFDTLIIWRILVSLGYIAVEEHMEQFRGLAFRESLALLDEISAKRMIEIVNTAIKETHL